MEKFWRFLIVSLVILVPVIYAVHLFGNYQVIQRDIQAQAARTIRPAVDDESVSEIGYIFSMRRDTYIRRADWNLVWFIAVPATNVRYSVPYTAGFQGFKVGDGVTLIHKKDGIDHNDYDGYVVGLHENERGKTADVRVLDLDELEMDSMSDN